MGEKFAVIDTETNWDNEVMSIGIVIAEDNEFDMIESEYIIFDEAAKLGGMFSYAMLVKGQKPKKLKKRDAISAIKKYLAKHDVRNLFAYNAAFDMRCLPELCEYNWHDILRLAAYKQYNPAIPPEANCCNTGRLKRGYKVEDIMYLFGEHDYMELHNALTDAEDELRIMKYLRHSINKYPLL